MVSLKDLIAVHCGAEAVGRRACSSVTAKVSTDYRRQAVSWTQKTEQPSGPNVSFGIFPLHTHVCKTSAGLTEKQKWCWSHIFASEKKCVSDPHSRGIADV